MPMLLVSSTSGESLVNYRVKDNTYIVDQLFKEAYLIIGAGNNQERVTITKINQEEK